MGGLRRVVVMFCVFAVASGLAVASVGASPNAVRAATGTAKWAVGDCYSDANVDSDQVVLSSKVACTKSHAVQIIGGAKLPATLASISLSSLKSSSSALVRSSLIAFANTTCSPGAVIANVYPKLANALQPLFLAHDVTEWVPAASGRNGWVFPDQASFDAGATDLLCIYEQNLADHPGSKPGDIRRLATKDALPGFRVCNNFNAANTQTAYASCAKAHDEETLINISLSVTGKPANADLWTDADWVPYDATCKEFAKVLIGADRSDLLIRSDTASASVVLGRRMFSCAATTPKAKKQTLPAGSIVGLGKGKLQFGKA
jgi:hypothetical protein